MNRLHACLLLCLPLVLAGTELHVGPGRRYAAPAAALARAAAGDVITVHPAGDEAGYTGVGMMVQVPRLTIRAAPDADGDRVTLDGTGFEHSGRGKVPRAVVQFDPQADDCRLEGFRITGGNNASHNGAGVRVNQANRVKVVGCEITGNMMGIMSNGSVADGSCAKLVIANCQIHRNGTFSHPGYNHNLYLGGTSVYLIGCEGDPRALGAIETE